MACSFPGGGGGEAAARLLEQGFTAMKFDPIPPITPAPREISLEKLRYTDAVLSSVRQAIGDKADILVGTHG